MPFCQNLTKRLAKIELSRFEHLAELEIVKYTERGVEHIKGEVIFSIGGQSAVNRRSIGGQSAVNRRSIADKMPIENTDRKKQILAYISDDLLKK